MSEQHIPPHELAAQIINTTPEVVNGRVESAHIGQMLERAEFMRPKFRVTEFENNEYGHVKLDVVEAAQYKDGLSEITVTFCDPYQRKVPLGAIRRLGPGDAKATAVVMGPEGEEPLLPSDPRWDAVVGVIERGIQYCIDHPMMGDH